MSSAEAPHCAGHCPLVAREAEGFSLLAAGFATDYELFDMEFQMIT